MVSVGYVKLCQVEYVRLPSLLRVRLVMLAFPETFHGPTFFPEKSLRRSTPVVVMTRAAEPLTGDLSLVDQTILFIETLWYQTEKV